EPCFDHAGTGRETDRGQGGEGASRQAPAPQGGGYVKQQSDETHREKEANSPKEGDDEPGAKNQQIAGGYICFALLGWPSCLPSHRLIPKAILRGHIEHTEYPQPP